MPASAGALLNDIIDYAGTFPPAGLTLAGALESYRRVKAGADAWLVGRLILPAAGLHDFEELIRRERSALDTDISVVLGPRPEARLEDALAFAARAATVHFRVASMEFPPLGVADIRTLARAVPDAIESFFEVPIDGDLERRVGAIEAGGARAKVRTGGVTAGVAPNPADLVRFLEACEDAGVAFKATAGLHHSVRGSYALTYEPGSEADTMHGFLNLAIAAAIVHTFNAPAEAVDALVETDADAFLFREDGVVWRRRTIATPELAAVRRRFFRSFGSCSVIEPIDELRRLNLI
jgi:hypothetical protein